jgi:hypothetical protein
MRTNWWAWPVAAALCFCVQAGGVSAQEACGELVTLQSHGATTTAYSIAAPPPSTFGEARMALILLPGSTGHLALDAGGCPQKLKGNQLVRSRELFHMAGFVTVLVDAPSDQHGEDGLGGFRISPQHAEDIGKVIAAVRASAKVPVWLVATSRGTISAVNAASRLTGPAAPDGLVLASPVTSGKTGGQKAWVAQTVFSNRLEAIRMPMLVIAHAADTCIRSPPSLAADILPRTKTQRGQLVTVTGDQGGREPKVGVEACAGRSSHGFLGQEVEVTDGIVRFIRGGRY